MKFDVTYEIVCGHQEGPVYETTLQDALVHPEHGLRVCIVDVSISTYLTRFIILKSPTLNLIELLDEVQRLRLNHAETINNQRLLK